MAQPFSPEQRDAIRARLQASARTYAIHPGVKKTSLDMLTTDAGISKSSFYKFYESKELLFLEIAKQWEMEVIASATDALANTAEKSDKARAAAMVYAAFSTLTRLGIIRFLMDDLPELARILPGKVAAEHYLASAQGIFASLRRAQIHFTQPDEIVLSVIQMLYLCSLNINEIGEAFFPSLKVLVVSACDQLVA